MFELLLATTLSCADGKWILDGIAKSRLDAVTRADLVLSVIRSMPDDCTAWQYKPDESTR